MRLTVYVERVLVATLLFNVVLIVKSYVCFVKDNIRFARYIRVFEFGCKLFFISSDNILKYTLKQIKMIW